MKQLYFCRYFSVIILFFSIVFVPFFFIASDNEYNLNQQIDRGHISRNAIFFAVKDPSHIEVPILRFTEDEQGKDTEPFTINLSPDLAEGDTQFVVNPVEEDGFTRVEKLLSSGNDSYFAAVHTGTTRYVYYQGNVSLPPLLEGRFISSEECLSREPLAVIGSSYLDEGYYVEDIPYIFFANQEYNVIGIAGINIPSSLDQLLFLNLGAIPPEEQMNGRFYIDGNRALPRFFEQMNDASLQFFEQPLVRLPTPTTLTDLVSGGVYLKEYLKAIVLFLFIFLYISILVQSVLSHKHVLGVMKIVGVSQRKQFARVYIPLLTSCALGIVAAALIGVFLILRHYFILPENDVIKILTVCILISIMLLIIWIFIIRLCDRFIKISEVTQKL